MGLNDDIEKAVQAERDNLSGEYAERDKSFQEKIAALEKEIQDGKDSQRTTRIKDFIESRKKDGKLLPVWEKMGLSLFLEKLGHEETLNFSESKKETSLDFMMGFIDSLPKVIDFREISAGEPPDDSDDLERLVADYAEKNKTDLKTATAEIAIKRPDLF